MVHQQTNPSIIAIIFNLVVIAEVVIAKVIIMDAGTIVIKCL